MKSLGYYCFIVVTCLCFACSTDEELPVEDSIEDPCEAVGPPEFLTSPEIFYGRSSATIHVQTNMPATVYYVVSDAEISEKTSVTVKEAALSNTGFISASFFTVSCQNIDSINSVTVENLPEETELFTYLVAESYEKDTTLQNEVTSFQFTTKKRLDTETFRSSVKSRDVLYVRYVPDEEGFIHPEKKLHPLIIFLGGNGEVAPPGEIKVVQNGSIPKYISDGYDIPFIVIAPEHTEEDWDVNFIHEVVEYSLDTYSVDPSRVIITGMSGGGIGTLSYAMAYPQVPAAIVPISGEGEIEQACKLTNMAVWAFHNQEDPKVPSTGSINMINAINACEPGATKEANLTIFQDEGHNCWIRVYNPDSNMWELDPSVEPINIYDWMLEQSK